MRLVQPMRLRVGRVALRPQSRLPFRHFARTKHLGRPARIRGDRSLRRLSHRRIDVEEGNACSVKSSSVSDPLWESL